MAIKKKILDDLRKSGCIVTVGKVGNKKRKHIVQTTFLAIEEM